MAKAKKLKSGSWRCLVYDYTDDSGKRHYKSFTADTKKAAEYLAAQFAVTKNQLSKCQLTVIEAFKKYIESKINILSQSTIRGYLQMETYYEPIGNIRLSELNQAIITSWVNNFSKNHSPKTVRNAHGLLSAILNAYAPEIALNTTLPQKVQPKYNLPSDKEVQSLIEYFQEYDIDMLLAVYLAAFGTLRRSEVCGLLAADVKGTIIHVNKAMVMDKDKNFVIKTTKTVSSDRYINLPDFVVEKFPKTGKIVNLTPDMVTHRFTRALKKLGIKHFRFHDLRHYSASIMHAIGIPDQYIMLRGGWQSDTVLKAVYRGTMDDYEQKYNDVTNDYFSKMQHKMQHIKKEPQ